MNNRILKSAPRKYPRPRQAEKRQPKLYVPIAPPNITGEEKISWAMETILSECSANGHYPYAETVVIQEILRRSGLSKQYLEKDRRKDLKQTVKNFLRENHAIFRSHSYRMMKEREATKPGKREESAELHRIRNCLILMELELDTATKLLALERAETRQLNSIIDQLRSGSHSKQI